MTTLEPDHSSIHSEPIDQSADAQGKKPIPPAVIKRLSLYSRVLQTLDRDKVEKVSSTDLARLLEINSSQVRKDLAHFGQFGVPGFGYPVKELRQNLKSILGTDKEVGVALVGVGHLGTALLSYGGFALQGFRILCAFDLVVEHETIGPDEVRVYSLEELELRIRQLQLNFAILTVPTHAAQEMTDRLVNAGITAIMNFVPTRLRVPDHVKVHYVDLALEMETLSYYLQ
ncbi:MAG: redox-sensing transcriptional repressor Rex [Sumerlaeia bacterium]